MGKARIALVKLLVCAAPLMATACGAANRARLAEIAAVDLACPAQEVEVQSGGWFGAWVDRAHGCGKDLTYAYDPDSKTWTSPVDRASFDLSCSKDKLTFQNLGNMTFGVVGCGQKATYVIVRDMTGRPRWVLNAQAGNSQGPASQ